MRQKGISLFQNSECFEESRSGDKCITVCKWGTSAAYGPPHRVMPRHAVATLLDRQTSEESWMINISLYAI